MSTMYLILGIIGWAVCPVAIFAYVWVGRRQGRRGLDVIDRER